MRFWNTKRIGKNHLNLWFITLSCVYFYTAYFFKINLKNRVISHFIFYYIYFWISNSGVFSVAICYLLKFWMKMSIFTFRLIEKLVYLHIQLTKRTCLISWESIKSIWLILSSILNVVVRVNIAFSPSYSSELI